MTGKTTIEWTDQPGYVGAVWNPTTGCTRVSAGCDNCYAFALHDKRYATNLDAARIFFRSNDNAIEPPSFKSVEARDQGAALPWPKQYDIPFSQVQILEERLDAPLRRRKPTCYFVDSMADLFHEDVPDEFLDRVWIAMYGASRHRFLILTKRPDRMREYLSRFQPTPDWDGFVTRDGQPSNEIRSPGPIFVPNRWPLPNVWLGTSVENQETADERIPHLLATPAAVRFLSCEPLLGPVDLGEHIAAPGEAIVLCPKCGNQRWVGPGTCRMCGAPPPSSIDWVIVGGESGPRARPMDLEWARSLVAQCRAADVTPFVKQMGSTPVLDGVWSTSGGGAVREARALQLRESHGRDMAEWPEDLRVREFPI